MALVISKVNENLKYTPMSEVGSENPFMLSVKPLDAKTLMILEDRVVTRTGESIGFNMGQYAFDVCKASVVGWDNINDAEGKPVVFEKSADGLPKDDTIAKMGVEFIQEVANVVTAISRDKSKIQVFFPEAN